MSRRPLIAHVLYRLDTGGMEQMLVRLINGTCHHYRHAVICLQGYGDFRDRIEPEDVRCLALDKRPGKDWRCYLRLWRVLRSVKPDIVHTYNFGALDTAPVARLAGVRRVVHAERGRDAADPNGENRKYRLLRRGLLPFIDRYLAVSADLRNWLTANVGIPAERVTCIPNGIDVAAFADASSDPAERVLLRDFAPPGSLLIGTVGRLDAVKDQTGLISAFGCLCEALPDQRTRLRLVVVGEGTQRPALESHIAHLGLSGQVRLLGNRSDIPALLAEFDVFALSSIAEGMPGVLLEAMASGLPVVATQVGGVGEVVVDGVTGTLVPASQPRAFSMALAEYIMHSSLRRQHGRAGRDTALAQFSLQTMLDAYTALYDSLLVSDSDREDMAAEGIGKRGED
ncbi:TIGR03088 family PEP-CTERM/XrtA system glycosyltransferase [Oleiagrimonas sp. C23AA]|uniref:TIGR03088 family PEP-CTERM/XrtA system glycosyltransferase n=1 Tax=Oleiagrimonas sp. C23AA TaxID=2719047 RepID=UPI00141FB473|nr:TIGR03088 family PEP-CTERM/XrtA system glycosyltransferase [Oleiagrimonas sp. C23AA]NII11167.1 TIGR03088 family PEP-CTERM/XrtA system glycosyltransferase [Oleiagrimonas sp. C23AA]